MIEEKPGIPKIKETLQDLIDKSEEYPYKYSMMVYFSMGCAEEEEGNILRAKKNLIKAIEFKPNFNPAV